VACQQSGQLGSFLTGYYHQGRPAALAGLARIAPGRAERIERVLRRRSEAGIPVDRVRCDWSFDLALAVERRLGSMNPGVRHAVGRWRVRQFDRGLAGVLKRECPDVALIFSDVGSEFALPFCKDNGIRTVLSMVHGDVREERRVLEHEAESAPDFFKVYLGDGPVDRNELDWLHQRRLRDIALADRILVPAEHIAGELVRHGTPRERIGVVPYAADTRRFMPDPAKRHGKSCTFLFAGGITQRKGIKYLLEAWRLIRRPGWSIRLLGALPAEPGPLLPYLDEVELLGRVPHSEVPARMAEADVFVFPSLFEGSAVVTYEALACGLPSVVTAESGTVARDGVDGLIVPTRDVEALAAAMERLGNDPELRAAQAASARIRALEFDWPRYHTSVVQAVREAWSSQG
jgi:alpha-maltose-1-phosphate synthase